jgi:N-succinyldiaminopimelate aminotransferase
MINNRLEEIGGYPFDKLRTLLDPYQPAPSLTPISLSVGEPQHPPPRMVREIINENFELWGKYPLVQGTPDFRSAVVSWLEMRYDLPPTMLDPENCVIPVSGTREALFMIALAAIPEEIKGQKPAVLMPNPFYQVYLGAATLAGAEPIFVDATSETGFLPDFQSQSTELLERTALAYYCSPANPQGMVAPLETLKNIINLAREKNFIVLFDECYSEIFHRDAPPGGLEACAALGNSMENVLVFNSLSKRSNVPGLRSGFVAGDPKLIKAFKTVRDYGGAPPPYPLLAAAAALWRDETHVIKNQALYRQKFDLADQILGNSHGYYRPEGGFYLWLNVGDGEEAALELWRRAAIRTIPGKYLSKENILGKNPGSPFIRCALVHDKDTTEEALKRLIDTL